MHKIEYEILNLFKKNPEKEFSTSDIVKNIFSEESKNFESAIKDNFTDKEKLAEIKRKNAQLHRQLLHHLNKLIKEDIIKVSKEGQKGEKYFTPNLNEGEEIIIGKQKRKIVITKPSTPITPIEGDEQYGIISKYESETWIERINSILIECQNYKSIEELKSSINTCLSSTNDGITLNNFESISKNHSFDEITYLFESIAKECKDYGKNVSLIIDFSQPYNENNLVGLFSAFFEKIRSEHIRFIFDLNSRELIKNSAFFQKSVEIFSNAKANFYIKNNSLHNAPYFVGAAGPYTFDENEWSIYKNELQLKIKVIACAQSAIAVDMKKFFARYKKLTNLSEFLRNIAEALLKINSIQRTRSDEFFKKVVNINYPLTKEFFQLSKNYIRFWNYGWKEKSIDSSEIINAISDAKKEIDTFATSQETIYLSCGIPTRFKVAFSCAFKRFDEKILGGEAFHKIIIKKIEDFYSDELKNLLLEKEKIFEIFDGGDRIRFFRNGPINPKDIEREIGIILNTYKLPFFCYDFGGVHGNLKLTNFIGEL